MISLNTKRRHLSESQRAAIASEIATLTRQDTLKQNRSANLQNGKASVQDVAEQLNVGIRSIGAARAVKTAFPETWEYIRNGDITVADAHSVKEEKVEVQICTSIKGVK